MLAASSARTCITEQAQTNAGTVPSSVSNDCSIAAAGKVVSASVYHVASCPSCRKHRRLVGGRRHHRHADPEHRRGGSLTWTCSGSNVKYVPGSCRG
jgi:hypothetical protein